MSIDPDFDCQYPIAPQRRSSKCIPLAEVDSAILLDGIALWRSLSKGRPFPSRADITPRTLKTLLRNTSLVRVIDGGRDYEYRIVGDAFVLAHGGSFQGKRWSETVGVAPGYHDYVKPVFDQVVREAEPVATRGWIDRGTGTTGYIYSEYVFLPLGETVVDHILVFAVYIRRDGLEHVSASFRGSFAV